MNNNNSEKRILEKTLENLSFAKNPPKLGLVLLAMLYLASYFAMPFLVNSPFAVDYNGTTIGIDSFAGVLSSIFNVFAIFLTLYYGDVGFSISVVVLILNIPMIISNVMRNHNLGNISGVFTTLVTILTLIVIYVNNKRIEKYQDKLMKQAVTDILTGLPNRFACAELVEDLIKKNQPFAVLSINLNGFSDINDTMGFDIGNEVLMEISSKWKLIADMEVSGTLDFIARLGGDEFALVIRKYKNEKELMNTINMYRDVLGYKLLIHDYEIQVSASYGFVEFPSEAKDVDSIFSFSNRAMLKAKESKEENNLLRFNEEMLIDRHITELENEIKAALQNNTIYYSLQPQFDMNHKLRGFEALARIKDKRGNNISPGEFIPIAEKKGFIDKVDLVVFKKAAKFVGKLIQESGCDFTLSINISVKHLMKKHFLDELKDILDVSDLPPHNLEIEITESIMIESVEKAFKCIGDLKAMGIQIAIDDFGTGYSSLSYLFNFPATLLKVDKSFIDKMDDNASSRKYVETIISLGHIMGIDVLAEGVETEDQIETLRAIGCDYIQGYVWGKPLKDKEAREVVLEASNA
ncbi:GGDEF-domain containing protein [Oribacterium sp. C9]|uniref:putative bifunctional diguanylate cyclase/phosphodiesterase n=1 Tax=Oribacterium sp. C9 TaxID=1943579 RepID=UPI0009900408|nr:bifunctional diguanylate cyclase/phosphodiesterase [Oribacterium sp. C9]OON85599.1 GGDEF-domain containing protein [Oribacterium sp. C9]